MTDNKDAVLKLAEKTGLNLFPGWVHDGRGLDNLTAFYNAAQKQQRESDATCIQFMFTDESLGETFALIIRNNTGDLT